MKHESGTVLKKLREEQGLTQKELSELSGINLRSLQDYEQGHKNLASAKGSTLLQLSRSLKCTMEQLILENDYYDEVKKGAWLRHTFYIENIPPGKKRFPIGIEDFEEMILNHFYYVDKTLLIRELLSRNNKVTLFTRPRRFGKTLNLSMLKYFFENTGDDERNAWNKELFQDLNITKFGEKYMKHACSYQVINLTLKSAKQLTFESSIAMLRYQIIEEFRRHRDVVECTEEEEKKLNDILFDRASNDAFANSIRFLSGLLYKKFKQKVIILIDEYDVPLEAPYFNGYYDEMISFIRTLFESSLKTNPYLAFSVITGCLRVSKESLFTGLNHLNIVSILNEEYSEHFGFTTKEVEKAMTFFHMEDHLPILKDWYDGYTFGQTDVYNPWSIVNYMQTQFYAPGSYPKPYWINTSSNDIIFTLIEEADMETRGQIEGLLRGGDVTFQVHEEITYKDIHQSKDNLWNFLYFTGYLTKKASWIEDDITTIRAVLPNREVASIYTRVIREWFNNKSKKRGFSELFEAMERNDTDTMEEILRTQLRETISYHDSQESFYHGFLSGLLTAQNQYIVRSNRESGNGRCDLMAYNYAVDGPGFVIEIKVAKEKADLEHMAHVALSQIDKKRYEEELFDAGCTEIIGFGISFYRKFCKIVTKKLL